MVDATTVRALDAERPTSAPDPIMLVEVMTPDEKEIGGAFNRLEFVSVREEKPPQVLFDRNKKVLDTALTLVAWPLPPRLVLNSVHPVSVVVPA